MSLNESEAQRVVFVKAREEGGINFLYDPERPEGAYQVFIHKALPYHTALTTEFFSFAAARSHAAELFKDWEMLAWDLKVERPCADGGHECGSGSCEMCKSTGGGCSTCGTNDDKFAQVAQS